MRPRPSHPGTLWKEIIEERAKTSISDAARRMGISRQTLHEVLAGRGRVTPELDVRFCVVFGGESGLWAKMQLAVDQWDAARKLAPLLSKLEPVEYPDAA